MMYAPVLVQEDRRTMIRPMRYTCRLAGKPADYAVRYPGTYNARRDSLSGFWNNVYVDAANDQIGGVVMRQPT